jgi:hypothetical protein
MTRSHWSNASVRLALLGCLAAVQAGAQERWENEVMRAGHAAFAAGRWDEALEHYRAQQRAGIRMGKVENWVPELIATVERRRELGAIAPADTHKVGVIFIRRIGNRADVTDEQKAQWRTYLASLSRVMETFSSGGWTLAFDEVDAVSAGPLDSVPAFDPSRLDIERWLSDHEDYDTFFTFSHSTTAFGGTWRMTVLPGVLEGPLRGGVNLNPRHDWTFMLHEFFHALQNVGGVTLGHAYRDTLRHRIPEWRGENEFDYYRWQFATRFAPRWSRLNHRNRYVALPPGVRLPALARIRAVYDTIPMDRRRQGRLLADSARRRRGGAGARPLLERALALSPYQPMALRDINQIEANRQRGVLNLYSERLATLLDAEEFVTMGETAPDTLGVVIGVWRPTTISTAGSDLEWDASAHVGGAGTYVVTLWFRGGWRRVRIASVALLENGVEVARDTHDGFSGTRKENVVYRLPLGERRPGAVYTVRARLYGMDGVDSHGLVFIRRS